MACSPAFMKCSLAVVMGLLSLSCMPAADDGLGSQAGGSGGGGGGSAGGTGGRGSGGSGGSGNGQPATGGSVGSNAGSGGSGGSAATGGTGDGGGSGGAGGSAGGAGGSTADARPMDSSAGEGPVTTPAAPKLSTDVLPITKMRCALAGCHDPIKHEHSMDLSTAATVYAGWVNKPTADHCRNNIAVTRVVPGKPENSFVVTLIEAPPGRCAEVRRMPPAPMPQLPQAEVQVIREWVAAGAKND
jgi:hypothetical protein